MNILITAGGTSERIDDVRHITNHSTGALGKIIAETFAADHETTVTYVHGPHALTPTSANIVLVPINSVDNLLTTLTKLLHTQSFDAVIHSMAVSDYRVKNVTSQAALGQELATRLSQAELDFSDPATSASAIETLLAELTGKQANAAKKINSQTEHLMITLERAPKVISHIKKIQPDTLLVGFKLLVDVPKEELQAVGFATLKHNQADFVLANDLTEVGPINHHGLLIDPTNQVQTFTTKQEIAAGIRQAIVTKKKGSK